MAIIQEREGRESEDQNWGNRNEKEGQIPDSAGSEKQGLTMGKVKEAKESETKTSGRKLES